MKKKESDCLEQSIRCGHEVRDASARGVFWFIGIWIVIALAIHIGLAVLFLSQRRTRPNTFAAEMPIVPARNEWPRPALELSTHEDLKTFRAREETLLNSYGWIDREKKIARIPINDAIEILSSQSAGKSTDKAKGGHE